VNKCQEFVYQVVLKRQNQKLTKVSFVPDSTHDTSNQSEIALSCKTRNMSALFVLIGISLIVASGFLVAFLWAMRKGQYDDDYTPSVRILFENEVVTKNEINNK
jgi:cbb3-type cytochrome oxidase maturation protein